MNDVAGFVLSGPTPGTIAVSGAGGTAVTGVQPGAASITVGTWTPLRIESQAADPVTITRLVPVMISGWGSAG